MGRNLGRVLSLIAVVTLCVSCGGTLTSKENARYLAEFDDIVDYDTPPVLVSAVRPDYPELARDIGAEGRVLLKVLVLEDGCVGSVQILEFPSPILVDEAITAVRKSVFAPATKGGHPCRGTTVIPFIFDKDDTVVRTRLGVEVEKAGYHEQPIPVEPPQAPEERLKPGK
jgi:TonB family protein